MPVAPRYRFGEDPFFKQQMAQDATSWERREREKAARQDALWGMVGGVFDFYQKGSMPKMDPTGVGGGGGGSTGAMSSYGGGGGGGGTAEAMPSTAVSETLADWQTVYGRRAPSSGMSSGIQNVTPLAPARSWRGMRSTPEFQAPNTPFGWSDAAAGEALRRQEANAGYPGVLGNSSGQRPTGAQPGTPAAPATSGYPGVIGGSSGQRPAATQPSTSMRGAGNDESALRQQALAQLMLQRDEKKKPQWYDYLG